MIFLLIGSVRVNADGIVLGDLNCDGRMSIADITLLIDQMKERKISAGYLPSSDLNQDSRIDAEDLHFLSNIITCQNGTNADTLYLYYHNADVYIHNPFPTDRVTVIVPTETADVFVTGRSCSGMIISVRGESTNGRLYVDSDKDYVLNLQGLTLESQNGPAFNSVSDKKVKVELASNTQNIFADAKKYALPEGETASGCFNSMGQLTFKGNGSIQVTGNSKHAIYCKKSITIDGGNILVEKAKSDALHSGKHININGGELTLKGMDGDAIDLDNDFTMTDGSFIMDITGEAAKGVKCGGNMTITDGIIKATASGALKNKNGDLSYCTILKCDSCAGISGGEFHLTNSSPGGKCISVSQNLKIEGGTFELETSGDGAQYINPNKELDYYTSKCIAVGGNLTIYEGNINAVSTGKGGKGILVDNTLQIGKYASIKNSNININVLTSGSSIINDLDEDSRFGCPKAIKCGSTIYVLGGTIKVSTYGMGGEGIESKDVCKIVDGTLDFHTYDDCINVENDLTIDGGVLRLVSENNDGIDSNNTLIINGGIVLSTSQHGKDESFDAEDDGFFLNSGILFGIGNGQDFVSEANQPYYANRRIISQGSATSNIQLTQGRFLSLCDGDKVIMTMYNENPLSRAFLLLSMPGLEDNKGYLLYESETPVLNTDKNYFDGYFSIGGTLPNDATFLYNIKTSTLPNNIYN